MSIQNLQTYDPFSDANKGLRETSLQDTPIHIRIQQRNGRKTLTTVQGIHDGYDKKKLVKAFKKKYMVKDHSSFFGGKPEIHFWFSKDPRHLATWARLLKRKGFKQFNCNGTVVENEEYGEVIQLQGDQRNNISEFLTSIDLAKKEQLHVHGF